MHYIIHTDGACAGNPGPMGIGGIIETTEKETMHTFSESVGHGTNNEAEYMAVIAALGYVIALNPESVLLMSDSQLVVNQVNGVYAINHAHLARLCSKVRQLSQALGCKVKFSWVPREKNGKADAFASKAIGMPQAVIRNNEVVFWTPDSDYKPDTDLLGALPFMNPKCKQQIDLIVNLSDKARFKDYAALRTEGKDGYSKSKAEDLIGYVSIRHGSSAAKWLLDVIGGPETDYGRSALRWSARGLPPDMALKKVSVDAEITANALKARSGSDDTDYRFYRQN